jgi:hypothetical protein
MKGWKCIQGSTRSILVIARLNNLPPIDSPLLELPNPQGGLRVLLCNQTQLPLRLKISKAFLEEDLSVATVRKAG